MTLDEFIAALEKTPRDWQYGYTSRSLRYGYTSQFLRRGPMCCCPITSLAGNTCAYWRDVSVTLGLDRDLSERIAAAADDDRGHDPVLRERLLKACGLAR